ncbi:hypothetical protein L9G15_03810 [Shewanella sp. A3A]|uniref:Uncharacterized protein n=1 Tax=Shewanella electrica TaxID=515560 RepID=A0ABT2FFW2_9GAMM|nr:hypothetical protein [Shewanella electrica]MCH1918557.1 hypothetical protein [Shewanella ferrihydritica]MCH1925291.1 hypothetical protein [Shewanella electrica]MCS4555116.1 hypothetical protein [Shewanella electrica]
MGLLQRLHSCFIAEAQAPTPEQVPSPQPEQQKQPAVPEAILTDEELRFILDLYN